MLIDLTHSDPDAAEKAVQLLQAAGFRFTGRVAHGRVLLIGFAP